jgi:hypothetical protein
MSEQKKSIEGDLRDGHLAKFNFLESNNLLPVNTDINISSAGFGHFAENQLTH